MCCVLRCKRWPFAFRKTAFCLLKHGLLHCCLPSFAMPYVSAVLWLCAFLIETCFLTGNEFLCLLLTKRKHFYRR